MGFPLADFLLLSCGLLLLRALSLLKPLAALSVILIILPVLAVVRCTYLIMDV